MAEQKPWCDLHMHSFFSDGLDSPEEMVKRTKEAGATAMALTDHDTTEGLNRARAEAERVGIDFIDGIELSTVWGRNEVHVLGLMIDSNTPSLSENIEGWKASRIDRIHRTIKRLGDLGYTITFDEVQAQAGDKGTMGRPHVARALLEKGIVKSVDEAFTRFLASGKPCYMEREMISVGEAISIIKDAKGIPVLAHPGVYGLDEEIREFRGMGLEGLEVYHGDHSRGEIKKYQKLCKKHDLLPTGGSDDHGLKSGRANIGRIQTPIGCLMDLRASVSKDKHAT